MKKEFVIIMFLMLFMWLSSETNIPAGNVSGNWTIQDQPYLIEGNINIPVDQSLSIESGVQIIFQGHYKFTVYGKITAIGAEADSILFTALNTEEGWYGLRFIDTETNGQDGSVLVHCIFEYGNALTGNEETNRGGVLSCWSSSNVQIADCRFSNNRADYGGALALTESDINLQRCIIENNFASHDAGGILINGGSAPIMDNMIVRNNSCNFDGGGIFSSSNASPSITNSSFYHNSALDYYDGSGGAISCWGAMLTLSDSEFKYNFAREEGGAIEIRNSNADLTNLIVSYNNSYGSGGIYIYNSSVSLAGVNVYFNTSINNAGGISFWYNSIAEFSELNRCNIYLNNSLNNYNTGNDISKNLNNVIEVIVDTFTVVNPTATQASPLASFSFDILNGKIEPVTADLYVSPDGSDSNSGLTPDDPLQTIFTALFMIEPSSTAPLTIHLADGVYSPSNSGETYPLEMESYLTICGTSREQTILDAEQSNRHIYCWEKLDVAIGNMTLTNGLENMYEGGGAIFCRETDMIITNTLIQDNVSRSNGGGISFEQCSSPQLIDVIICGNETKDYSGGGISCQSSNPVMQNVTIKQNFSKGVGGGVSFSESFPEFDVNQLCSIYLNNTSINNGKDIYTSSDDNIVVTLDTFTVMQPDDYFATPIANINLSISNAALEQVNADLYVDPNGSNENSGLTDIDPLQTIGFALMKIIPNETDPHTIHLAEGLYSETSNSERLPIQVRSYITISGENRESTIIDAENQSNVVVCKGEIDFNIDNVTISNGYDIYNMNGNYYFGEGAGFNIDLSENISINNLIIKNNVSGNGAGIYCDNSKLNISNTLFYNNQASAQYSSNRGGAIYCSGYTNDFVDLILSNLTFFSNSADEGGGAVYLVYADAIMLNTICWGNEPQEIFLYSWNEENEFTVSNSDFSNGQLSITNEDYVVNWLEGNLDDDPLFMDPVNSNFYLHPDSPCIDAGTAFFEWNGEVILDLSPDEYYGDAPDIGAFEWDGTPIDNEELIIANYELRNFPNPFNPETKISFSIPEESDAELLIYNIKGQKVKTFLINSSTDEPINSVVWNGEDDSGKSVSSGIYFYKLKSGSFEKTKKMLLLK
ncbi:T9SS type A sorting domain-containing protein [Candidatus Cloacimonadota bacterium]